MNPLDLVKGNITLAEAEELSKAEEGAEEGLEKAAPHKYHSRRKVGGRWVYDYGADKKTVQSIHDAYGSGDAHHKTGEVWSGVGEWPSSSLRSEGIRGSDLPTNPPTGATHETHAPITVNGKLRYVSKKDHPAFFAKLQARASTQRAQHILWGDHARAAKMKVPTDEAFLAGMQKAGGEGSRGGHIIGHTGSGKPIYARGDKYGNVHPDSAKTYTKQDHKDAIAAHMARVNHADTSDDDKFVHYDLAAGHHEEAHGSVPGSGKYGHSKRRMGADPHPVHPGGAPGTGETGRHAYESDHPWHGKQIGKAMTGNPLDLVKSQPHAPTSFRLGSVTYHNAPVHGVVPQESRPSLHRPSDPEHVSVDREQVNPLDLVRMGPGVLTHPNGRNRRDDGR